MSVKKFSIDCEIEERWVDTFCSFLKNIQSDSSMGHSEIIGFYADGDGDCRMNFDIHTDFKKTEPEYCENYTTTDGTLITEGYRVDSVYDAG